MDAQQREVDQRVIASERKMTDAEFLETMSRTDSLIDHDPDSTCGMCHHQFVMAQVARDMIVAGETEDVIKNEAIAADKDPNTVFGEHGWEP